MNITDMTATQARIANTLRSLADMEGGKLNWTTMKNLARLAESNTPTTSRVVNAAIHDGITFEDGAVMHAITCEDVSIARGDDWLGHAPGYRIAVNERPTIGVNVRTGELVY